MPELSQLGPTEWTAIVAFAIVVSALITRVVIMFRKPTYSKADNNAARVFFAALHEYLDPPPDAAQVREIGDKLTDPVLAFVHMLANKPDPGLLQVITEDLVEALARIESHHLTWAKIRAIIASYAMSMKLTLPEAIWLAVPDAEEKVAVLDNPSGTDVEA